MPEPSPPDAAVPPERLTDALKTLPPGIEWWPYGSEVWRDVAALDRPPDDAPPDRDAFVLRDILSRRGGGGFGVLAAAIVVGVMLAALVGGAEVFLYADWDGPLARFFFAGVLLALFYLTAMLAAEMAWRIGGRWYLVFERDRLTVCARWGRRAWSFRKSIARADVAEVLHVGKRAKYGYWWTVYACGRDGAGVRLTEYDDRDANSVWLLRLVAAWAEAPARVHKGKPDFPERD